jgi:DNA-binding transcriptional MerR regulator
MYTCKPGEKGHTVSGAKIFTIGELAQAADVTTRTIRYYVAQGLLPPPYGGGRAASYGEQHLHRLELIKLLKQEFLPLNEIKALLYGLDDDAVRTLLQERRQRPPAPAPDTAKEYLRTLLNPDAKSPSLLRQTVARKAQSLSDQPLGVSAGSGLFARRSPVPAEQVQISREDATAWQRYSLHPDVELHVRQPAQDAKLSTHLDRLVADIRRLIAKYQA